MRQSFSPRSFDAMLLFARRSNVSPFIRRSLLRWCYALAMLLGGLVSGSLAADGGGVKLTPQSTLTAVRSTTRSANASADCPTGTCDIAVRPHDQLWVISTRRLGCPGVAIDAPPAFAVTSRLNGRPWQAASFADFLASDNPAIPTCFVIHGNRFNSSDAVEIGMLAYHRLTASLAVDQPVRFVIWSWPSDRVHGILQDVRIKAARTPTESMYLGWVLHQLNPQTPVSLVGFSFGARIASGALHLAGGGSLNGFAVGPPAANRRPTSAVLVAAAMGNHWLAEGAHHGQALHVVDRVLNLYNHCDAVLKRYHLVDRCGDADALGYTGLAGWSPFYSKVQQVDACCAVGKKHDWEVYLASPRLVALMSEYAWPEVGGLQTADRKVMESRSAASAIAN